MCKCVNVVNGFRALEPGEITVSQAFDENGKYEVMQFTGLQDKNGKDVFEGDILDIHDTTIGSEDVVRGEVYWCDSYLEWSVQWLPKQSGADSMRLIRKSLKANGTTPESSLGNRRWPFIEVIGNIYENKELLNEK